MRPGRAVAPTPTDGPARAGWLFGLASPTGRPAPSWASGTGIPAREPTVTFCALRPSLDPRTRSNPTVDPPRRRRAPKSKPRWDAIVALAGPGSTGSMEPGYCGCDSETHLPMVEPPIIAPGNSGIDFRKPWNLGNLVTLLRNRVVQVPQVPRVPRFSGRVEPGSRSRRPTGALLAREPSRRLNHFPWNRRPSARRTSAWYGPPGSMHP